MCIRFSAVFSLYENEFKYPKYPLDWMKHCEYWTSKNVRIHSFTLIIIDGWEKTIVDDDESFPKCYRIASSSSLYDIQVSQLNDLFA
jgi:hypothetical protein